MKRPRTSGMAAVELNDLVRSSGEWLRGDGPEADIVISSRIRLARNVGRFPLHQPGHARKTARKSSGC